MALRRWTYLRAGQKNQKGYSGVIWNGPFTPQENYFEVWVRPRWVKPEKAEFRVGKLAMNAQLGATEYRIGEVIMNPGSTDWVVLRGRLTNARVHWQEEGMKEIPLRAELIQHIAIRTEIADMEFDYTGLMIWSGGGKK
jgi:hypothetical protein